MKKYTSPLKFLQLIFLLFQTTSIAQTTDSIADQIEDSVAIADTVETVDNFIQYKIGDLADGNKSVPVHLIKLYDNNGFSIHKNEVYPLPFSTKNSCGDCHTYDFIKNGTHFSIDTKDSIDRSGEPYIYTDHQSLTILPLSYRGWDGTIYPDSVGITPFEFLKFFGSHLTGGNITENESIENSENYFRWQVSGKLEINCLVCHDKDPEYDQAEFAKQIKNENFKWATSAASSIANGKGYARKMPDNFDPYNSNTFADVDLRTSPPPSIVYNLEKFDEDNKVFFDIEKRIDSKRCRYCHTTTLNTDLERFLIEQEDVHISAGLSCIDCHKNGIDHKIISGYEEEYIDKNNELLHSYSCEGCHISSDISNTSGRYGAPKPLHEGIPLVHFEKLSCTVCHSTYWPSESTNLVKTSRSHKLGVPGPNKMASTFPLIQSPVFVRAENGKLEPRNLIWPSYWGSNRSGSFEPLDIGYVKEIIKPLLGLDSVYNYGTWPKLDESKLITILDSLNNLSEMNDQIAFVSGGILYELDENNELIFSEFNEGKPYTWAIAHNVRPAQQSLGINGCDDCHSVSSDFYFGNVSVISSVNEIFESKLAMVEFQDLNSFYQSIFSFSFYFRPILKIILILSALIIILVATAHLLSGMKTLTEYLSIKSSDSPEGNK